jgi:hypothetical protein
MKATVSVIMMCLALAQMSRGSEEITVPLLLQTVTLHAARGSATHDVIATFSFSPIAKTRQLEDVSVEYDNHKIKVPQERLTNQPAIRMESARISSEAGWEGDPWVYLSFEIMDGESQRYYIAFQGDKFVKTFTFFSSPHGTMPIVLSAGQSTTDAVFILSKIATDLGSGLDVARSKGEGLGKNVVWKLNDYDLIVWLYSADGKITKLGCWTKKDFDQPRVERLKAETEVTTISLDPQRHTFVMMSEAASTNSPTTGIESKR